LPPANLQLAPCRFAFYTLPFVFKEFSMFRVAKPEGIGNIILEDVPIPDVGERDVLVRNKISLISRGSEILRRYMHADAIDPAIMGYSVAGVVEKVGAEAAERFQPGDRVIAVAPHAQFVIQDIDSMDGTRVWPLPASIPFAQGAFLPLTCGAVWWAHTSGIQPGDTVVVLGQGLAGNLVMQSARQYLLERLIAVDVIDVRCALAAQLGADVVINAAEDDPVAAVMALTNDKGANVVIDCVGGRAGIKSFAQALDMSARGGTIHLIGLYHGEPLPLDAGKIQGKKLLGGYYTDLSRAVMQARAIELVERGHIQLAPLISHRFPYTSAKEAYDLLYDRLAEAIGVLLVWEEDGTDD
jgi:threonine dehydrogenase-like Zn-dependent dehydrogenase